MRNTSPDIRHKIQRERVFSATKCAICEIRGGVRGTDGGEFEEHPFCKTPAQMTCFRGVKNSKLTKTYQNLLTGAFYAA